MSILQEARSMRAVIEQAAASLDDKTASTATAAFALGELGWLDGKVYKSLLAANVYTPEQHPAG